MYRPRHSLQVRRKPILITAMLCLVFLVVGALVSPLIFSQSNANAQPAAPASAAQTATFMPRGSGDLARATVLEVITWSVTVPPSQPAAAEAGGPPLPSKPMHTDLQGFCTGWFVGTEGQIASAGHCFDAVAAKQQLLQKLSMGNFNPLDPSTFSQLGQSQVTMADLPDPDLRIQVVQPYDLPGAVIKQPMDAHLLASVPTPQGDNSLIKVDDLDNTPALPVASSMPAEGTAVRSIGFSGNLLESAVSPEVPINFDNPFADPYQGDPSRLAQDVSHVRFRPSMKNGTVDGQQFPFGTEYTETGAALTPGMSGGPTVFQDRDGVFKVVGSNDFITDYQSFNFITGLKGLRGFLADHGIQPVQVIAQPQPPASDARSGLPVWAVVLLTLAGVAVVAVVALATWLLTRRHYRRQHNVIAPTTDVADDLPSNGAANVKDDHTTGEADETSATADEPTAHDATDSPATAENDPGSQFAHVVPSGSVNHSPGERHLHD